MSVSCSVTGSEGSATSSRKVSNSRPAREAFYAEAMAPAETFGWSACALDLEREVVLSRERGRFDK